VLTIGVAIDVPEPFGSVLQQARVAAGDPLAKAIPPHVTLLPPTVVSGPESMEFEAHCERVAAAYRPFELELHGTGTFRPVSPVVFVALAQGAEQCSALERAVRAGPVERLLDFPYHPHVTIAHHLPDEALAAAECSLADFRAAFTVSAFHLYHHGADEIWRPVVAFELGARVPR